MNIKLIQIDGKLPNLALMKLSHYFKAQGDSVVMGSAFRELGEPDFDKVFASQIFEFSNKKAEIVRSQYPQALIGGTGTGDFQTVEQLIGLDSYEHYDYSIYPKFEHSIGFTQRGCRLRCKFCVVPQKEGKIQEVNTIHDIWRGEGHSKKLHLLDNDFFGQAHWLDRCDELYNGNFEVCLNQGINVRLIHQEGAQYLSKLKYRDDQFKTKRIYTAWDNKRDEAIFLKGIRLLLDAGIKPSNILVYFLCGFWKDEDFQKDIMYRFEVMSEMGLMPYPMVYDINNQYLRKFQRWVIRKYYQFTTWAEFSTSNEAAYLERKNNAPTLFE